MHRIREHVLAIAKAQLKLERDSQLCTDSVAHQIAAWMAKVAYGAKDETDYASITDLGWPMYAEGLGRLLVIGHRLSSKHNRGLTVIPKSLDFDHLVIILMDEHYLITKWFLIPARTVREIRENSRSDETFVRWGSMTVFSSPIHKCVVDISQFPEIVRYQTNTGKAEKPVKLLQLFICKHPNGREAFIYKNDYQKDPIPDSGIWESIGVVDMDTTDPLIEMRLVMAQDDKYLLGHRLRLRQRIISFCMDRVEFQRYPIVIPKKP
jgi:hypothetical protein